MPGNRTMRVPAGIAHVNDARAPVEPASSPSPFAVPCSEPYTRTVRNSRIAVRIHVVNDARVVHRDVDDFRLDRSNLDVPRIFRHLDALVGTQVTMVIGGLAHALDGFHHIVLLVGDRIAKLVAPGLVLGHHLEHRRERQKRLYARVVRQVVVFHGSCQGFALQVLMALRPGVGRRNLVAESRGREHMDQERVRIKRNIGYKRIELRRGIIRLGPPVTRDA